jgi:hypothetical protein
VRRKKIGRTTRRRGVVVSVTDRDVAILSMVGMLRFVAVDQIIREFEVASADRIRRVARRLYDGSFLHAAVTHSREATVVSLSRRGLEVLQARDPELAKRIRLPSGSLLPPDWPLRKLTNDVRLFCAALAEVRGATLLRWSEDSRSLRQATGLDGLRVAPSAVAAFSTPEGAVLVAIELDLPRVSDGRLTSRLSTYRVALSRAFDSLWLVTDDDEERVQALNAQLIELGLDQATRVLTRRFICERPVDDLPDRASSHASPDQRSRTDDDAQEKAR